MGYRYRNCSRRKKSGERGRPITKAPKLNTFKMARRTFAYVLNICVRKVAVGFVRPARISKRIDGHVPMCRPFAYRTPAILAPHRQWTVDIVGI